MSLLGDGRQDELSAFLASIVEGSDDSIIGTTLDGTIVSWNRGAQVLFGYSPAEAIGKRITMLFRPGHESDHMDSLTKVRREERIEHFESIRVAKDGTPIDVSVILSPIRDSAGQTVGISAIYRDITRRKLADAQLLRALQAGEAANRAKAEFLNNISHEFRTPLIGILGMTDMLLDSDPAPGQREHLGVIKDSAQALLALITQVLELSSLEARKLTTERVQFGLRKTMLALRREMVALAQKKGLALRIDVASETPDVLWGDPQRLRQILLNLVENAIKFTHAGEIEITVGLSLENSRLLSFMVRDTGIGVPADRRLMIFKAFTQADGSLTRRAGGAGLGLAVTAGLVELLGGNIWVESDGEHGSAFCFTLPVDSEARN